MDFVEIFDCFHQKYFVEFPSNENNLPRYSSLNITYQGEAIIILGEDSVRYIQR